MAAQRHTHLNHRTHPLVHLQPVFQNFGIQFAHLAVYPHNGHNEGHHHPSIEKVVPQILLEPEANLLHHKHHKRIFQPLNARSPPHIVMHRHFHVLPQKYEIEVVVLGAQEQPLIHDLPAQRALVEGVEIFRWLQLLHVFDLILQD